MIKAGLACLLVGLVAFVIVPNHVGDGRNGPVGKSFQCINNLRQIDAAKNEWALENRKTNGDVCTEGDIKPLIHPSANGKPLKCPSGGKYTIGKVGEPPTCSLGTNVNPPHVLQ
jgi:hypothetical protein